MKNLTYYFQLKHMCEVVFSWHSFYTDLMVQVIATGLTFIFGYKLLSFQFRNDDRKIKNEERNKLLQVLDYAQVSIINDIKKLESQIKSITDFISQLESGIAVEIYHLNPVVSLNGEWINSMDRVLFYKAFMKYYFADTNEIKYDHYNKLFSNISFIKRFANDIIPDFNNFIERCNYYEKLFDESKTNLIEFADEHKRKFKAGYLFTEDEKLFMTCTNDWYKESDTIKRNEIHFTFSNLIQKMEPYVINTWDKLVLKCMRDSSFAYENYVKHLKVNQSKFSALKASLEAIIKDFENLLKGLEKTEK